MNTEIPHLKIEQLTNGCIRLENESAGNSYVVDIHPVHLRYMAEVSGLIRERSTSEEAMEAGLRHRIAALERDADRMQRSMMCVQTRTEQLFADLCLQHDNGHEDLTLEVAKCADTLFNMYKYANDGVKRDSGAYYVDPMTGQQKYFAKLGEGQTVGPDGSVSMAPGYAASNASSKGLEAQAVEAAKYPFAVSADRARQTTTAALDTQPVIAADGNTYYTPRLNVAMGGAGPMGGSGGTGAAGGAGAASGAPSGFMASRNPITQQSAIAINDNWLKNSYQPTIDAGRVATDLDANIQALRNIDIKTGWTTEARASAASVLAGLGISKGNADMFAANAQKFQSVAMDKLMTTLQVQKGTSTEGDADRAKQTFVSLKNTPEANNFILDFAQAKTNMDRRRAQYYEQALPLAQKEGDLTKINRQTSQRSARSPGQRRRRHSRITQ